MFEMIRRIFKIAGNSRGKIVAGIFCNILKSFFNGFMMFGVFWILLHLDRLSPVIIGQAFCVILGSVLGRFFFQWMYDRTMSGSGYDIFRDYRLEIGERLKQAPMGYFSEQNLGTIQAMLTTTIADLEGYSMLAIEQMTSGVAMTILTSVMMFFFSPVIAGLSLAGLVLGMLVLRWVRLRAAQYAPIYQEAQEHLVGKVMEYIRGISVLRSFSKGDEGQREVRAAFQQKWDADYGQEKATAGVLRFYGLTFKLMSCVLIAAAALLYLAGQISLPYCLTFLFCAFTVYSDLETMGNSAFLSKRINTELDRLEKVTDIPKMDTSAEKLAVSHFDISLEHISFGYGDRRVIHDISLKIPEHTTCAIVGPSGSGKTTLCNLIARFWDVQEGAVRIGGENVQDYTADSVLEHISMVFQNVYLFHDSVENNIRFGRPEATHEQVVEAAKRACCHGFILSLPNEYDTIIGEGGSTLSGGEKQRISIARAILKDAPIVILDEATSSVDPENEQALLSAIQELTKDKTLISIAHRLSTVQLADQIIVIEQGRIVQQGKHAELLQEDGIEVGVGHHQPRLHKPPHRRAGVQAEIPDRQLPFVLHCDGLNTHLLLKQLGGHRRVGHGKAEDFPVFLFQLRQALLLQEDAVVDDPDVVGQQGDLGEDVAGDQDGLAPFVTQRPDEVPYLGDADGVQAVDGLVQDQQLRVVHHRQGDGQPLFHAQGVLGVAFLVPVRQVHQLQRAFDVVGTLEAPEPGEDLQVFCAGQVGVESRGLDEAADAGQDALLVPLQRPAEEGHCAGCGGGQP